MVSMTPSELMTQGQVGKIQELLGAGLRKASLASEPTQQVLEGQGNLLVDELVAVVRKHVEAVSNLIIRRVRVNRVRSPQEALDATCRKQYTDRKVVDAMPKGEGEEVEVVFFKLGRYVSDTDLEQEYALRGLKPCDPYSLDMVNTDDPAFADKKPNGTHWQNTDGKWGFSAFRQWVDDERHVYVYRDVGGWDDSWWFAGLRK